MVIAFLLFMVNTLRKKLAEERRWNIERLWKSIYRRSTLIFLYINRFSVVFVDAYTPLLYWVPCLLNPAHHQNALKLKKSWEGAGFAWIPYYSSPHPKFSILRLPGDKWLQRSHFSSHFYSWLSLQAQAEGTRTWVQKGLRPLPFQRDPSTR
jgi:hypothetical protein